MKSNKPNKSISNNQNHPKASKVRFYDRKKWLLEIIPLIILIAMAAIAFYIYPRLPDNVPIHWNASGNIDNYGSKYIAVFLIPIIYLLFVIFSILLPAMDVFKENIKSFYKYYYAMKVLFGIFFLVLYIATLMPNFGYAFNIGYIILLSVIILFFALGFILRHVKRNFFIGIRTPWTLANDKIWEKTHNVGGFMFMALSLILLIGILFLDTTVLYIIFVGLIILMVIFLMFYSYYLYKRET